MPVHSLIHAIGSTGIFPSRAFLPAFVTAFVLRFSDSLPLVAHAGISAKADAPSWFVCNVSLVILALLSCVEWWATKDADVRQFLDQFDAPVKSGMALITSLGLASAAIMSDEDELLSDDGEPEI